MSDRNLSQVRKIAMAKGIIKSPEELQISKAKNKRFAIKYDNKTINFGLFPYQGKGSFLDHGDEKLKAAWRARHSKIMKDGKPAYLDKTSPEFWAWHILWA
jgi:hypothetical protein